MNDETELDPTIVAALRAVPPADDATREAHLAAALDQLGGARPVSSSPRQRWLSVAAAAAALAGGFAIGRAGDDSVGQPRNAAIETTTTAPPVKTGTRCAAEVGDGQVLAEYESDAGPRMIVLRDDALDVIDAVTCASLQTIPLP